VSDQFVPLAVLLRPQPAEQDEPASEPPRAPELSRSPTETDEAIRAARLFRAGIADALEAEVGELLRRIARDVLGRELLLASADVKAVVDAALERHAGETALAIRVHPADLEALAASPLERISDDRLRRGDVIIEMRSGTIDASLDARLDSAVRELIA
jgi:flagellar biosynthesis/type III secretory pathway protein FliH